MNLQHRNQPSYAATRCGIKLVARPVHATEQNLLHGRENSPLVLKGPTEDVLATFAPSGPWTHDTIQSRLDQDDMIRLIGGDCADAYLGDRWIGGTEV